MEEYENATREERKKMYSQWEEDGRPEGTFGAYKKLVPEPEPKPKPKKKAKPKHVHKKVAPEPKQTLKEVIDEFDAEIVEDTVEEVLEEELITTTSGTMTVGDFEAAKAKAEKKAELEAQLAALEE